MSSQLYLQRHLVLMYAVKVPSPYLTSSHLWGRHPNKRILAALPDGVTGVQSKMECVGLGGGGGDADPQHEVSIIWFVHESKR